MKIELLHLSAELEEKKQILQKALADKENNAHKLQQEIEVISYKYDRLQKQSLETSTVGKKLISLTKKNRLEDSQLPTDKTWHSIMTEVDKIYPQFYSLLKEAFPNLTESEYQYCYLHIFGFDANDEAKLLGINPASVRMKRTRIYQEVQLKHNKETVLFMVRNFIMLKQCASLPTRFCKKKIGSYGALIFCATLTTRSKGDSTISAAAARTRSTTDRIST